MVTHTHTEIYYYCTALNGQLNFVNSAAGSLSKIRNLGKSHIVRITNLYIVQYTLHLKHSVGVYSVLQERFVIIMLLG